MSDPFPNIRAALWADNPTPETIEAARREHGEAMQAEHELTRWQRAYERASNQVAAHNMAIDDGDDYGEHVGLQRHRRAVQTGHDEVLRFFSAEERAKPDAPLPDRLYPAVPAEPPAGKVDCRCDGNPAGGACRYPDCQMEPPTTEELLGLPAEPPAEEEQ